MRKLHNLSLSEVAKRRKVSVLILSMYSTQIIIAALANNLHVVSGSVRVILVVYYIASLLSSTPQSGLSDECGRKKHLVIATSVVLASGFIFFLALCLKNFNFGSPGFLIAFLIFLSFAVLGVAGNVIPISRGCLCALHVHDFRSSIGVSTFVVGLGWITANLLRVLMPSLGVLLVSCLFHAFVLYLVCKYYHHDEPTKQVGLVKSFARFVKISFASYRWLFGMFLIPGGLAAILAYLFSDTSFYPVYILGEEPGVSLAKKVTGMSMGIGYTLGVIVQWAFYASDESCIKRGLYISAVSVVLFFAVVVLKERVFVSNGFTIEIVGFLRFLFSFGFGFFVPALFSIMSSHLKKEHYGKLFGVIDTFDTLALVMANSVILIGDSIDRYKSVSYGYSLILFFVSFIMFLVFLRKFKSYETRNRKS